jgi:DNA-binding MarR family transcriptional regulator
MQSNSNSELLKAECGGSDFDIPDAAALATLQRVPMPPPETQENYLQSEPELKEGITHLDIVRVVERLHRRSLDLMRTDLIKAGITDLSPSQVMMLFTIGSADLSVRELIERGYYLGSNASYILKRLVEGEYIVRMTSERDRRSARVRLSEKGLALCETIRQIDRTYHRLVTRSEDESRDLEITFQTLMRLEKTWSNALRYGRVMTDE